MASASSMPPPGVPPGSKAIVITSLINPSWYVCRLDSEERNPSDVNILRLEHLESEMSNLYSVLNADDSSLIAVPTEDQLVAVYASKIGKWVRGSVVVHSGSKSVVHLIDYGSYLYDVKIFRTLPVNGVDIPAQSCQILLDGVLPVGDQNASASNRVGFEDWAMSAQHYVVDLLKKATKFYFLNKRTSKDAYLGDVYFILGANSRALSLTKALCDKKFAECDHTRFDKELFNNLKSCSFKVARLFDDLPKTGAVSSRMPPNQASGRIAASLHFTEGQLKKMTQSNSGAGFSSQHRSPNSNHRAQSNSPHQMQQKSSSSSGFNKNSPTSKGGLQTYKNSQSSSNIGTGSWHPSLMDMDKTHQVPVLAQGSNLARPLESIGKAPFHTDIHRALEKMNIKTITNQQRYMWPTVFRGDNIVSIGASASGKTVGYVAPLASKMMDLTTYSKLKGSFGPLVLILCDSAEKATDISNWFKQLTANSKATILLTHGGGAENEKMIDLLNGTDVLITTPSCFLRMIAYWKSVLADFDRLCHLVFEDADNLFENFHSEVSEILALCNKGLAYKAHKGKSLQIIAVSRHWTEAVEQFSKKVITDPTIIVSSGTEIFAYSKMKLRFHDVKSLDCRPQIAVDILKSLTVPLKIVVACNLQNEALEIHRTLKSEHVKRLLVHEGIGHAGVNEQKAEWNSSSNTVSTVLVVSDGVLSELEIFDADVLVNYSMTVVRNNLNTRIACLIQKCPNLFQESKGKLPEVHFMMTEGDTKQIPVFVDLLKRLKQPIPEGYEEKAKVALKEKELAKKNNPLCDRICTFGSCSLESTTCSRRHGFVKDTDESPSHIPQSGEVKMKFLHVNSATHFAARLEEHKNLDGTTQNLVDKEHVFLPMNISQHFENPSNRRMVGSNISSGTICAVESSPNLFQRVSVESIVHQARDGSFNKVIARSLDVGWRKTFQVNQLYHLPENLQRPLPQAIDVFLCRVKPRDEDPNWSKAVNDRVCKWLESVKANETKGHFLYGKIKLSVGGKLWVDPLECRQYLENMGIPSILFSIRSRLLEQKLALDNPTHITRLYDLCKIGGLVIPEYNKTQKKNNTAVRLSDETLKPSWAFLDQTNLDVVNAISLNSPSSIFIQRVKFQGLLDDLLNNICDHQNLKGNKTRKYTPTTPGSCVLAKYHDSMWYRAIIERIENQAEDMYALLFVDFGDRGVINIRNMLPIPDELLSKLPFQTIECSLANVIPSSGLTWSSSASDKLVDLTRKDDDLMKSLVVKVVARTKSSVTGGYRYAVNLYDLETQCEINASLVESGLAKWLPNKGPDKNIDWDKMTELMNEVLPLRHKTSNHIILTAEDLSDDDSGQETENASLPYFEEEPVTPSPNVESNKSLEPQPDVVASNEFESDLSESDIDNFLDSDNVSDSEWMDFLGDLTGNKTAEMMRNILARDQEQKQNDTGSNILAIKAAPQAIITEDEEIVENESIPSLDQLQISDETSSTALRKTAFEPTIMWSQNRLWVTLKIDIGGVETYELDIGSSFVDFTTETEGKVYFFAKNLFGYINPAASTHQAKGLYVEIKLRKLTDSQWPRLERSKSDSHRTVMDVDVSFKYRDSDESEEEDSRDSLQRWLAENKLGNAAISKGPGEGVLHDLNDNDSNDEDDNDFVHLQSIDPYDPLN